MSVLQYATAQAAICDSCRLTHPCMKGSLQALDFFARHKGHRTRLEHRVDPDLLRLHQKFGADMFREVHRKERYNGREIDRTFELDKLGEAGYRGNANVAVAFGTSTSMTITNANLASSATAGWQSAAIDNTTNLYLDYLFQVVLASVASAPASDKTIYMFGFGLVDPSGTAYTSTGAATPGGSEGTLTYPNVSTIGVVAPLLGTIPYLVTTVANNSPPMSYALNCGLQVGATSKLAIGMVNFSGMTLSVTSIKFQGVYLTVV